MKKDPWEHSKRRGLSAYDDDRTGKKKYVLNCSRCGRYLGESNQAGAIAGKFPCTSCKNKTEV